MQLKRKKREQHSVAQEVLELFPDQ